MPDSPLAHSEQSAAVMKLRAHRSRTYFKDRCYMAEKVCFDHINLFFNRCKTLILFTAEERSFDLKLFYTESEVIIIRVDRTGFVYLSSCLLSVTVAVNNNTLVTF